jgi:S1-C subfamily serine protease
MATPQCTQRRARGRFLGIDEQPAVDSGGRGMQVVQVYAGTPAQQAGLQVGDVIHSANGYLTQEHGNVVWIIANTPANGELRMNVRTVRDGADHLIIARIP